MVTEEKMLRFKNVSFRNIVKVVEHRKKIMSKEYTVEPHLVDTSMLWTPLNCGQV